jgi:hypothetical protein
MPARNTTIGQALSDDPRSGGMLPSVFLWHGTNHHHHPAVLVDFLSLRQRGYSVVLAAASIVPHEHASPPPSCSGAQREGGAAYPQYEYKLKIKFVRFAAVTGVTPILSPLHPIVSY